MAFFLNKLKNILLKNVDEFSGMNSIMKVFKIDIKSEFDGFLSAFFVIIRLYGDEDVITLSKSTVCPILRENRKIIFQNQKRLVQFNVRKKKT